MSKSMQKKKSYRPNVAAVILSPKYPDKCEFFVAHRSDIKNAWQFPQGGIDPGETPEQAVIREAGEETGIPEASLKVIKKIPESHTYLWPAYAQLLKGFAGQEQTAYLLEFSGNDKQINLDASYEAEDYQWFDKEDLVKTIYPVRQEFARQIVKHL